MPTNDTDPRRDDENDVDGQHAREDGASAEPLREKSEGRDIGNPTWWKNEGGSGEAQ